LQIVAEACDGFQAVHKAELFPDLVLLDIGMPVLNGLDAADQVRRISPRSKIVFLTLNNDGDIRRAALDATVGKSVQSDVVQCNDGLPRRKVSFRARAHDASVGW